MFGIKGLNGATGIYFTPYSGSTAQKISINGAGVMTITGTIASTFSGNLTGTASHATIATTANRLAVYNNFAYTSGVQYYQGQPKMGTTDGLAYEGSSSNYKLWSFPAGGTAVDRTNNIANVQVMRFYWGSTYFTDLFISPN